MPSTTGASPLETATAWIAGTTPLRLLAVAATCRAVICGVFTTPSIESWLTFARDPLAPELARQKSYVVTSPIGPFLASGVGATDEVTFALLHLAVLVASVAAFVVASHRLLGAATTKVCVVVLLCSPLSNVLLTWLGLPDAFTIGALSFAGLAVYLAPRPSVVVSFVAALVLGFEHFEQGAAAVAVLALVLGWAIDRRPQLLALLAGLLVGRVLQAVVVGAIDVDGISRADFAQGLGVAELVERSLYNLPLLVASAFGLGWLLVWPMVSGSQARRRLAAAGLVGLAVATVTLDSTRVVALVTWPTVVLLVGDRAPAWLESHGWRRLTTIALVGAAIPPVMVVGGTLVASSWGRIVG